MTSAEPKPRTRRFLRLGIIGLTLIAAAFVYRHFWLAKPVGTGPAGPGVPRAAFAETWISRPAVLLGIGDSVTAGLGSSRKELSYFNRLVHNPVDESDDLKGICLSAVIPDLETKNIAVSGSNSIQHLAAIEGLEAFPDSVTGIVVMTTGGNDLIHWYGQTPPREGAMYGATLAQAEPWIRNFEQRLTKMLDLVQQKFPGGCEIFLGDIYDPSDGVGDAPSVFLPAWQDAMAIHSAYNAAIHRCAERGHVHLVPVHETFLGHGIHCTQFWRKHYRADDPHYWFYTNLEDPNDRGYDALRRIFLLKIAETFSAKGVPAPWINPARR